MERNKNETWCRSKKFPNGMKAGGIILHAKGWSLVYTIAAHQNLRRLSWHAWIRIPGMPFYVIRGIDYLKYDWCYTDGINAKEAYSLCEQGTDKTGRPIVFSLCEWWQKYIEWAALLRTFMAHHRGYFACYDCIKNTDTWSALGVVQILDKQNGLRKLRPGSLERSRYAGSGCWLKRQWKQIAFHRLVHAGGSADCRQWYP